MLGTECQKPGCDSEGENTYRGENGNSLRLCDTHYYAIVKRGGSGSSGGVGLL